MLSRVVFSILTIANVAMSSELFAQHGHQHYSPGYHIDHHDDVVRDSHGHVIARYHHDVVHQNSTYVLPHLSSQHHGTYFRSGETAYYYPRTASADPGHYRTTQPQVIKFGGFSHVDDLASRLETLCNEFCLDLHYNYSHNPGFRETYVEAYEILQVAKFIHSAEHQNDRQAIASRLKGLDELFHHVQDDARGWDRHDHRQIGQLGIITKMDMIETTLHHLMNDVGVHVSGSAEPAPAPSGNGVEQAPPPSGSAPPVINSAPPAF